MASGPLPLRVLPGKALSIAANVTKQLLQNGGGRNLNLLIALKTKQVDSSKMFLYLFTCVWVDSD